MDVVPHCDPEQVMSFLYDSIYCLYKEDTIPLWSDFAMTGYRAQEHT